MSPGRRNALRFCVLLGGVLLLGWWFWPRRDAPETEAELTHVAYQALAARSSAALRRAVPTRYDLNYGRRLAAMEPDTSDRTLRWLAYSGSSGRGGLGPSAEESLRSAVAAFEPVRAGKAVAFDRMEQARLERGSPGFRDLFFRVQCDGVAYRFRLGACYLTPRGWVTLEGLFYEGPVGAQRAAVAPGSVVYRFAYDPGLPTQNRAELLAAMRRRVARSPYAQGYVLSGEPGSLYVVMPPGFDEDGLSPLPLVLAGDADVRLYIEILPDAELERRGGPKVKAGRHGIWPHPEEEFGPYVDVEIGRWRTAQTEGRSYVPAQAARRLLKRFGTDGSRREHFHLVEEPSPDERISSANFTDVVALQEPAKDPALALTLESEAQMRYYQWTQANRGLVLVLCVGGEVYGVMPIATGYYNVPVELKPVTPLSLEEAEDLADLIEGGLGLPPLGYPLRFHSQFKSQDHK